LHLLEWLGTNNAAVQKSCANSETRLVTVTRSSKVRIEFGVVLVGTVSSEMKVWLQNAWCSSIGYKVTGV
jgi:hypothetical protein